MKPREKKTAYILVRASEHLRYELQMLRATSLMMGGYQLETNNPLVTFVIPNAVVESFVVHVRNLTEFFYAIEPAKPPPKPTDMIADDFFAKPEEWARNRPAKTPTLQRALKRAHKELSHLTYSRLDVNPQQKQWPNQEIVREMEAVVRCFLETAPRENLSQLFFILGDFVFGFPQKNSDLGNSEK